MLHGWYCFAVSAFIYLPENDDKEEEASSVLTLKDLKRKLFLQRTFSKSACCVFVEWHLFSHQ